MPTSCSAASPSPRPRSSTRKAVSGDPLAPMTRWKLTIEYDGSPFMGWQRQEHGPSVQQALEEALQRMTGEPSAFTAAGRTDAGVHALAMSTHVDVMKSLTAHRLRE